MILTETTAYDRASYPLSLDYVEAPQPERLIQTIKRMKQEYEMGKSATSGFSGLNSLHDTESDVPMDRTSQSFYSMPEAEMEAMSRENLELRTQISQLEQSM